MYATNIKSQVDAGLKTRQYGGIGYIVLGCLCYLKGIGILSFGGGSKKKADEGE